MKFLLVSCLVVSVLAIGAFSEEKICEPGEMTQNMCGPCVCNMAGTDYECENTECLRPFPPGSGIPSSGNRFARALRGARRPSGIVNAYNCIPGTTFQDRCNSCYCFAPGNVACTLVAC